MAKPIMVKITGDVGGFKKALGEAEQKLGKFVGGIATKGAAIGGALAAAGGAVAVSGIQQFAAYEEKLNEVMTLLPGAGAEVFDSLNENVKNFATEFGVLPEEVVPALYQALSAGVPQDNVFEFLETAQQAAKGGVTDLETAVDGISSVVNAYGEDVISAAEASDLMFTAVRLGKTNFEELSGSLFQVAPIAASLGVEFEDVTASLANLTAQGVPTSVAATQMKGALSELGKEGTKASDAFLELSGQTFTDFIDSGGNVSEAFVLMTEGAEKAGGSVLDMFGSIEAGQAVLGLTSDGGEAFAETLDEMSNSAGATETAFETMDGSMTASFDRIKASMAVAAISIGEALAPSVEKVTTLLLDKVVPAVNTVIEVFSEEGLGGVMRLVGDTISANAGPVFEKLKGWLASLGEWLLSDGLPMLYEKTTQLGEALIAWIGPRIQPAISALLGMLEALGNWMLETGLPMMVDRAQRWGSALVEWIGPQIGPALEQIGDFIARFAQWFIDEGLPMLVDKLIVLGDALVAWIKPRIVPAIAALTELLTAILTWIVTEALPKIFEQALKLGLALLSWVANLLPEALKALGVFLSGMIDWIQEVAVPEVLSWAKGIGMAIIDGIVDGIKAVASKVMDAVQSIPGVGLAGDVLGGIGGFLGFANGGHMPRSGMAVVGERGPELVRLPQGAEVIPNHDPRMGGGSNITVNVATSASPHDIAREVAWVMSTGG
jgi:TP901 family phage tail tape measure protein